MTSREVNIRANYPEPIYATKSAGKFFSIRKAIKHSALLALATNKSTLLMLIDVTQHRHSGLYMEDSKHATSTHPPEDA